MRIIFFDIDGTLILTQGAGKIALRKALKEVFAVSNPNADINYGGRTDLGITHELFSLNGLEAPSPESIHIFFQHYVSYLQDELEKHSGLILPGIESLLAHLHKDDSYHLGIITGNIEKGAMAKLLPHKLNHFFSFGGFGDREFHRDGIAREGLKAASTHLSKVLEGHQCLVIGDTPHDITCSKAIGAFSIGVCTGYAPEESIAAQKPTRLLKDLSDTQDVLATIDDIFLNGA